MLQVHKQSSEFWLLRGIARSLTWTIPSSTFQPRVPAENESSRGLKHALMFHASLTVVVAGVGHLLSLMKDMSDPSIRLRPHSQPILWPLRQGPCRLRRHPLCQRLPVLRRAQRLRYQRPSPQLHINPHQIALISVLGIFSTGEIQIPFRVCQFLSRLGSIE